MVVRASLRTQLTAQDYEVFEAEDGNQALGVARDTRPDVVLLDVELPGLDGYEVLRAMKADPDLCEVPVVFLTGRHDPAEVVAALSLGAHDYLRKPFESAELLARVRAALRVKALQDELHERLAELDLAVRVDSLTGLFNRRHLTEHTEIVCSAARRRQRQVSVLMIDVDRFKSVNDSHGHAAGDAVLQQIAERLRAGVRAEDMAGRWGGEEFVILLPDTGEEGAVKLAERLRFAVANESIRTTEGLEIAVTVSIGCATGVGEYPDALLKRADAALYVAKAEGRDRVVVAT